MEAFPGQGPRRRPPGDAAADHGDRRTRAEGGRGRVPGNVPVFHGGGVEPARQTFQLAGEPRTLGHDEPRRRQASAHGAGGGKGCDTGAGRAQTRELAEHAVGPHFRIAAGREAVQEPGVDTGGQFFQHLPDRAEQQGQGDPAAIEAQAVEPRYPARIGRPQFRREWAQFGKPRMGVGQIARLQRKALDRDDMQARIRRGRAPPRIPQGQHVQARAESQFADREPGPPLPDLGHADAVEKHVARLVQAAFGRKIDVPEVGGTRHAVPPIKPRPPQGRDAG